MTKEECEIVLFYASGTIALVRAVRDLLILWDMRWMEEDARVVRAVEDWIDMAADEIIGQAGGM